MKLRLTMTLELDPDLYDLDNIYERQWLSNILKHDPLSLHSTEIGNFVGRVKVTTEQDDILNQMA